MPTQAKRIGSVGKAVPGIDVSIYGSDSKELPRGPEHIGEIAIRGSNVMRGYYNQPEATAEAIKNGWFYTGDLGYIDKDGYVYIAGRKKEMIIRGGQNIYPREIEDVIAQMPGVKEVAVVGVPDELMGERVKAVVVVDNATKYSEHDVKEFCKEHLAPYKLPKLVEFIDALPRNSTGKILKRMLV